MDKRIDFPVLFWFVVGSSIVHWIMGPFLMVLAAWWPLAVVSFGLVAFLVWFVGSCVPRGRYNPDIMRQLVLAMCAGTALGSVLGMGHVALFSMPEEARPYALIWVLLEQGGVALGASIAWFWPYGRKKSLPGS